MTPTTTTAVEYYDEHGSLVSVETVEAPVTAGDRIAALEQRIADLEAQLAAQSG